LSTLLLKLPLDLTRNWRMRISSTAACASSERNRKRVATPRNLASTATLLSPAIEGTVLRAALHLLAPAFLIVLCLYLGWALVMR